MRVCLLKILPEKRNLDGNMDKLLSVVEGITESDVDVFITPEGYLDGYMSTEEGMNREAIAQYGVADYQNPFLEQIANLARQRKAWFVFGCIHNSRKGPRNAAFLFDRKGDIAGVYYKTHLQRHDLMYVPGDELPVYESDFGPFGVMICADRRWPETVRTLALKGAKIIFNPTFGMHDERNRRMMRTRSYESEITICFCHPQESLITGPNGEIEAHMVSNRDGFLVHDVDLSAVDEARERAGAHLKDRMPDLYA